MYLKDVQIKNYGCIKDLNYKIPFNENGTPKPIIVIGQNGSGKTLLLSNIIHSLIEFKKQYSEGFNKEDSDDLYRVASTKYICSGENYYYNHFNFTDNTYHVEMLTNDFNKFKDKNFDANIFHNIEIEDKKLVETGFYQGSNQTDKKDFDHNVYLYFPVERYYIPTWLNKSSAKLELNVESGTANTDSMDIIRCNVMQDIEKWILDVIIDKLLYEKSKTSVPIDKTNRTFKEMLTYKGKNNDILTNLNFIISEIVKVSDENCASARLGVSSKKGRRISIIKHFKDNTEKEYVPTFENLSSGQIMILSLFATILKEYDKISNGNLIDISNIKGMVLIDEIDNHLHSDFCRRLLPKLISLFSGIQFIVSSHSPFYLLGMKEVFGENCEFLSLPKGTINNIEKFDEIRNMYELFFKTGDKTVTE